MQKAEPQDRLMRWPIRGLVWPFIALILVSGWVALIARVQSEREDAERAAIYRSQDRATLLEQHVIKTLQIAALASHHLGDNYISDAASGQSGASAVRRVNDPSIGIAGISAVTVLDRDGRTISLSRSGPHLLGRQFLSGLSFNAFDGSDLAISTPRALDSSGRKFIVVTRRVMVDGRIAGYVALSFRPEQFLNFPLRTNFLATDLVSVITLDGITLARREGSRFSSGEDVTGGMIMGEQRDNPNGTYRGPSALDGHVRYFSHRRIDNLPVFVTAGVSYSVALASAQRRAAIYFGIMGILSVIAVLMAWLIQREVDYRGRKAAQLAESAQRFRAAQRIGKIGDWEYDLVSGTLIWSDELCEMYERSPADDTLTLAEFSAYLRPDEFEKFEAELQKLLANGGTGSCEIQVLLPSGNIAYRCLNAVAAVDSRGKVTRLYGTDQDVTQSHLVGELGKQVAHLDRQGAMSMMAGTLAHELNQPLTAASNYITGALRSANSLPEYARTSVASGLNLALDQVHGAAEIIRRVRKMVQVETDMTRTASIREAVTNAVGLLMASGFPDAEKVVIEVDQNMPEVRIAPIQLQQVLVNLLKNALEAAPPECPDVSVRASRDEGLARIEVCDNGPGFPAALVNEFLAFQSDKENGTGLGLSISRTIVEFHGGKLRIEKSKPGETVIAVLIPLSPSSRQQDRA